MAVFCCVAAWIFTALGSRSAIAEDPPVPKYGWREVWTGADAMRDVWLIYTGVTLAPWSEHVHDPGWRLRAQTGYGEYDYVLNRGGEQKTYRGTVAYGDALVGYHWRAGDFIAKLFAGVSYIDHAVLPGASKGHLVGPEWGPKVAAELWLNIGDAQWTSLNVNFTTAHDTASLRWRYGFTLWDGLAAGPEVRLDTNGGLYENYGDLFREYEGRAGLFATYTLDGYELTLAGGVAAYVKGLDTTEVTPYGTINFLMPF